MEMPHRIGFDKAKSAPPKWDRHQEPEVGAEVATTQHTQDGIKYVLGHNDWMFRETRWAPEQTDPGDENA